MNYPRCYNKKNIFYGEFCHMQLAKIKDYWNDRAEGYSLSVKDELSTTEKDEWAFMLNKYAPDKLTLDCLDIGCGPGFFSILLAKEGHNVTAVDYSEKMLEQAKQNAKSEGVDVYFTRMDAQKLSFEDECFDYIVSRDLSWNLEFPEQAYREWLRVLRPGGRIFIFDGNYYLHYYSDKYNDEVKSRENKATHKYMLGVDPTPINSIAKALPLSRQFRPAWDISFFIDLGVTNIQADIRHKKFISKITSESKTIIDGFSICLQKPLN